MKRALLLSLLLLLYSAAASAQSTGPALQVRFGATDPATCTANRGLVFFNTTSDTLKVCSATNTWTAVGGTGDVTASGTFTAERFILGAGGTTVKAAASLTGLILGNGASAPTAITTSAGVFGAISDETGGSGVLVGSASPVFSGTPTTSVASSNTSLGATAAQLAVQNTDTTVNNYSQFVFLNDEGNSGVGLSALYSDHTAGAQTSTFNVMTRSGGSYALRATIDSTGLNLASGEAFKINGTSVLNGTTLGSGVTASSLTSFGANPVLGAATGTSLALGGGSIGADALEVTGSTAHNGAVVISGSSFSLSGNQSAVAWTTNGIRYKNVAATLTDTTSTGTVATAYTNVFGGSTIAASSATTFTNYFNTYFIDPVAGTNVTMTSKWALGADSLKVGTSNPLTVSTTGVLAATNPKITTGILDANGAAMLAFSPTASAVNGFTFTNAATAALSTVTLAASGSDAAITLALASKGTGNIDLTTSGVINAKVGGSVVLLYGSSLIRAIPTYAFSFSSSTALSDQDLGFQRSAAGVGAITDGLTVTNLRDLKLRSLLVNGLVTFSATAPTIAAGFGTSPVVAGTATAFTITVGTGGTDSTGTITFPAATTGWIVQITDVTNNASFVTSQTGGTTTTATIQNYSRTTGTAIAWTAGDVLRCTAVAY